MDFLVIPFSVVAWFLGSALLVQLAVAASIFIGFASLGWLIHKAYDSKGKSKTDNFKEEAVGPEVDLLFSKEAAKQSRIKISKSSPVDTTLPGVSPSMASKLANLPVVKFEREIVEDYSEDMMIEYHPLGQSAMGKSAAVRGEDAQKRPFISYTYMSETGEQNFCTLFKVSLRNNDNENKWAVIVNSNPLTESNYEINCKPLSAEDLTQLNIVLNAAQSINKKPR